jgi:hypothetical protein
MARDRASRSLVAVKLPVCATSAKTRMAVRRSMVFARIKKQSSAF